MKIKVIVVTLLCLFCFSWNTRPVAAADEQFHGILAVVVLYDNAGGDETGVNDDAIVEVYRGDQLFTQGQTQVGTSRHDFDLIYGVYTIKAYIPVLNDTFRVLCEDKEKVIVAKDFQAAVVRCKTWLYGVRMPFVGP
jgi:hypothetical protein